MLKIYFAGSIRGGRADADLHKSQEEPTCTYLKAHARYGSQESVRTSIIQ